MYRIEQKKYPCSSSLAMHFIGGKWKTVILVHLIEGTKRYSELNKEIPTITERTLSLQLRQLEEDKLITRKVLGKKPPLKVEYSLTDFGRTLLPVLKAISDWGESTLKHCKKISLLPQEDEQPG